MSQITATFRIVTPMFLGGADPTQEAELRVPSIKGALRFWWRALMWGKVKDVAEMHRREGELFGSSDKDIGQSKFLMRLEMSNPAKVLKSGEVMAIRGDKAVSQNEATLGEGARYLGYGLMEAFTGKNTVAGRLTRSCLTAPFEFKLHLRFKAATHPKLQAEILGAVKLLGLCGGLGSRARRGYGSVSLVLLQQGGAAIWSAPKDAAEWERELKAAIGELPQPNGMPEWTGFSRGHSKALLLPSSEKSSLELLSRMGRDFVFFRSWGQNGKVLGKDSEHNFEPDHDLMNAVINQGSRPSSHPERVAFGLPQNYFFSSTRKKGTVEPADDKLDRRASSLFFHIHQPTTQHGPLGVLLFLPSRFLPKGKENISAGGTSVPLAHGGSGEFWNPVHDFLERFLPDGNGTEKFNEPRLIHL